jgi:hypothetical protein
MVNRSVLVYTICSSAFTVHYMHMRRSLRLQHLQCTTLCFILLQQDQVDPNATVAKNDDINTKILDQEDESATLPSQKISTDTEPETEPKTEPATEPNTIDNDDDSTVNTNETDVPVVTKESQVDEVSKNISLWYYRVSMHHTLLCTLYTAPCMYSTA